MSDPAAIHELMEFLQSRGDVVLQRDGEDELEVSVFGSYALDAMRMELYLRIRAWEAARRVRGVTVELVDEPA